MRMKNASVVRWLPPLLAIMAAAPSALAQESPPLGAAPAPDRMPAVEFAFEERVTLAPATVVGDTAVGRRQYIPITGGEIAGPLLNGRIIPGGWDYQQIHDNGCAHLSADYFLETDDGTVIRILNEGLMCDGANGQRSYMRPRFEAPEGPYGWMTRGTFVATIEPDTASAASPADGGPPALATIRIKVYQIK
jgi:hypothetical protein